MGCHSAIQVPRQGRRDEIVIARQAELDEAEMPVHSKMEEA